MIWSALFATSLTICGPPAPTADDVIRGCADFREAERRLAFSLGQALDNARLNDEMDKAEPGTHWRENRLMQAQNAWLTYRVDHCASLYLAPVARELEPVNRVWCMTRLTKQRAEELSIPFTVD